MYDKFTGFLWRRKYFILFLALFAILLNQRFLNEKSNGLAASVATDGTGYYAYLPAAIIYHDFSYSFYAEPKNKIIQSYRPYIDQYINNTQLNKYYCGTAICLSPFFICGIIISTVAGTSVNGYTDTFLMLVSLAPIIYFLLSVLLITKIGKFFSISEIVSFLAALVFFFGTNLFHFVIQEPSISHAYSFFAVSLFFYLFTRLIQEVNIKNLVFLGLSLGLIVLIRPPNVVVVLFLPFFFQSFKAFFLFFKMLFSRHLKGVGIGAVVFVLSVFIQSIFYYLQTGDFFIMAYPGESFYFDDPEFFNILFSYRKGLFMYTPIIFACLIFIVFAKGEWNKKISLLITFGLFLYIAASWWCWTYGGGFGNRPFIDIYPLFIITTIYLLNKMSQRSKKIIFFLCLPFVFLNQVMAYQYTNRMMNTIGNITENDYWDIFLKTDLASINRKKIDKYINGNPVLKTGIEGFEYFEDDKITASEGFKSHQSNIIGEHNNYSSAFRIPATELEAGKSFYVVAECMAKANKRGRMLGLAISVSDNGITKIWDVSFYNQFDETQNGWTYMNKVVRIDKFDLTPQSVIGIFAYSFTGMCWVDNLKYTIVKENPSKEYNH